MQLFILFICLSAKIMIFLCLNYVPELSNLYFINIFIIVIIIMNERQ